MAGRFCAALLFSSIVSQLAVSPAGARQFAGPSPTAQPPCTVGGSAPAPADRETIQQLVDRFEGEAERAAGAGDHQRAASLYLQAERHLPMCAASARAERVRRALAEYRAAALDTTAGKAALLGAAHGMLESFLLDVEISLGEPGAAEVEEVSSLKRELVELQRELEAARTGEAAVKDETPAKPPECPVCATSSGGPTGSDGTAFARRTRWLAGGLGVSAGLMLAAAGAGLALRLRVVEGHALHREIQTAAEASTSDEDPSNDVPHGPTDDICQAASVLGDAAYASVSSLCAHRTRSLNASTAMFITTGALAVTTAVFAALLAQHRRSPTARELARRQAHVGGGLFLGGGILSVAGRF